MKKKYPFEVIDLRFQVHQIVPKKIQLFGDYRGATSILSLFMILIGHRENKITSDGYKVTENIILYKNEYT